MADSNPQKLLTHMEAAALLQRHMPTKSALAWLKNDRDHEPAIPFINVAGDVFYQETDLLQFIEQFMKPVPLHTPSDPRSGLDRRNSQERRIRLNVHLRPGIERRGSGSFDRRVRGADRRHLPHAHQAAP